MTGHRALGLTGFAALAPLLASCAGLLGADFDRPGASPAGDGEGGGGTPGDLGDGAAVPGRDGSGCADARACEGGGGRDGAATADGPIDPGSDGGQVCRGTALACAAFVDAPACGAQIGCAWTVPACSGAATNCATTDPNVCYARQPACTFDFNARECYPAPDWCSVTTPADCAAHSGCTWSGGCSGTAAACDSRTVAQCPQQKGCSVVSG